MNNEHYANKCLVKEGLKDQKQKKFLICEPSGYNKRSDNLRVIGDVS